MTYTAYSDTFVRDNLPPRSEWPEFVFELPELKYPARLNCAGAVNCFSFLSRWRFSA